MPIDTGEVHVAFTTIRQALDASGYGHWVSDAQVMSLATSVVQSVEHYRSTKVRHDVPPPQPPSVTGSSLA